MHIDEERENRDREYQIVSSFIPVINKNLKPGVIETCNFLNPQSGVYCRIHQTLIDFEEGTYLFFTAQPLSEANNTNALATNFLNDVLLLSTRFSDAKDQVDNFIEITRMEYEAEHVYVAELQTDGSMRINFIANTSENRLDVENQHLLSPEDFQKLKTDLLAYGYAYADDFNAYNREKGLSIPEDPSIRNSVLCPVSINGDVIGFYFMTNFNKEIFQQEKASFIYLGNFLGSILVQKNLLKKVDWEAKHDHLTRMKNRSGLYEKVEAIDKSKPLGYLSFDMNDLKVINDTYGHEAGDKYITSLSDILLERYGEEACYRMGGDEFLVLLYNPENAITVMREEKSLQEELTKRNLSCAIGSYYTNDLKKGFDYHLNKADEIMYKNKAAMKKLASRN